LTHVPVLQPLYVDVHRLPVSALQPTEYQSAEHDVDARSTASCPLTYELRFSDLDYFRYKSSF